MAWNRNFVKDLAVGIDRPSRAADDTTVDISGFLLVFKSL